MRNAISNERIENAFRRFDEAYHDTKAILSAITWIASTELQNNDEHEATNTEAFGVLFGLGELAEKLMEQSLYSAGADQRESAFEALAGEAR